MRKCQCGGIKTPHEVGEGSCYREKVPFEEEPVQVGYGKWSVDGHRITTTTLFQQRMYSYKDRVWTRPKDGSSLNLCFMRNGIRGPNE